MGGGQYGKSLWGLREAALPGAPHAAGEPLTLPACLSAGAARRGQAGGARAPLPRQAECGERAPTSLRTGLGPLWCASVYRPRWWGMSLAAAWPLFWCGSLGSPGLSPCSVFCSVVRLRLVRALLGLEGVCVKLTPLFLSCFCGIRCVFSSSLPSPLPSSPEVNDLVADRRSTMLTIRSHLYWLEVLKQEIVSQKLGGSLY